MPIKCGIKRAAALFLASLFMTVQAFSQSREAPGEKLKTRLEKLSIPWEERPAGEGLLLRFPPEPAPAAEIAALNSPPGEGLLEARFVLVIPLSSQDYALETGLGFAEMAREKNLPAVIFFAGEEGLKGLAEDAANPGEWILCYLDMPGPPSKLLLGYKSGAYTAPLGMLRPLYEDAFEEGFNPVLFESTEGDDVLNYLWEMDINAMRISGADDGGPPLETEKLAQLLINFSQAPDLSVSDPERNYGALSVTRLTERIFFIPEKVIVRLILAALALVFMALGITVFFLKKH